MKITIETIPHTQQRYPTVGDWFTDTDGTLVIRVSDLGDSRMEALVAIHELVEVLLCQHKAIPQAEVDAFDIKFEATRMPGNTDEPGDDPQAPYKRQHCLATGIERTMASALDVDWSEYEGKLEAL